MKRLLLGLAGLFVTTSANAARLDERTGEVQLDGDVLAVGFEGQDVAAFRAVGSGEAEWDYVTAADAVPAARSDDASALEGGGVLRVEAGKGFVLESPSFASLQDARFSVTVWARAEGVSPRAYVSYAKTDGARSMTGVRLLPTGRATSDGWYELATGTIDGRVLNIAVKGIVLGAGEEMKGSVVFDGLEVKREEGAAVTLASCTDKTVDAVCGAEGECLWGRCVPATSVWGALPSRAIRLDAIKRWITYAARWMGDRAAASRGEQTFVPAALALADAKTAREFYAGLAKLVNGLRDGHTSLGVASYSSFVPTSSWATAAGIGGCFNLVLDDRGSNEVVYAVQDVPEPSPSSGVPLQRGDVLVSVDGMDPEAWAAAIWPTAGRSANDERADHGRIANHMADLLSRKAARFTVARCKPSTDCSPANRTNVEVDLTKDTYLNGAGHFSQAFCTPRLVDAVPGAVANPGGVDAVFFTTEGDTTFIQFDGFMGDDAWSTKMTQALSTPAAKLVIDTRIGNGGTAALVDELVAQLRGVDQPWGRVLVPRGRFDIADPDWLTSEVKSCVDQTSTSLFCTSTDANFSTSSAVAANKRVAWLHTLDVSGNDFAPRALKGRTAFRIFGPHVTEGAFGGVMGVPPVLPGWSPGSIQIQDTRFVNSIEEFASARWESGHGVEPDEVVVQKLSDLLQNKDTFLDVARAWLDQ